MKRKLIKIAILFVILLLIIGYTVKHFYRTANTASGFQMPPIVVESTPVIQKNWQPSIETVGSLVAYNGITLTAETAGRVTAIYFNSGDFVKQGTPLIQLDDALMRTQLQEAQAELNLSEADYQRSSTLYKQHIISQADFDKATATRKVNQAKADNLQAQENQTLIKAPFDGNIGIAHISVGSYLTPGQPIADFQALDPILVNFDIPEASALQLRIGNKIQLTSPAATGVYQGQITALNSKLDTDTRTLEIQAEVINTQHQLLPGMFVTITAFIGTPQPVLIIPQTAVSYSDKGDYVYRIVTKKAVKTPITLGKKLSNNQVIISKGLNAKDSVIIGGQVKLQDGALVTEANKLQSPPKGS